MISVYDEVESEYDSIDYTFEEGEREENYEMIREAERRIGVLSPVRTTSTFSSSSTSATSSGSYSLTTSTTISIGSTSTHSRCDSDSSLDEHDSHHLLPSASGSYCLECREKEMEKEIETIERFHSHVYENCGMVQLDENTELYARLLTSVLIGIRDSLTSRRKMRKLQKKIEKTILLNGNIDLSQCKREEFPRECARFGIQVERRLRVIRDYSPIAYHKVSAKVDKILSNGRSGNITKMDRLRNSFRKVIRK